jgi:hypothetical protein
MFYLQQHTAAPADVAELHPAFGCFYYALWPENRVRIHFRNGETVSHSPLSRTRRPQRLAELAAMFRHLRSVVPPTATVVGGSWLYNIDAYCQLPVFSANNGPVHVREKGPQSAAGAVSLGEEGGGSAW